MAFQSGSQVRPELGNADYSGFARAGEIWGQALANVGDQIAGTLKKKKENEDRKAREEAAANILMSQAGLPYEDAKAAVKGEMADTVISLTIHKQKMEQEAREAKSKADYRSGALGLGQQRVDIAQAKADVETKNAAAQKAAIDASTDTSQNVDWKQAASIYTEQGGQDLKGFMDAAEAAQGPGELEIKELAGVKVITQGGKFKMGVSPEGIEGLPASIKSSVATEKAMEQAQKDYDSGTKEGRQKAQRFLSSYNVRDSLDFPAQADAYFGGDADDVLLAKQKRLLELREKRGQ